MFGILFKLAGLLLLFASSCASSENPGFVVRFTRKGLGLVSEFSRDLLEKYLKPGQKFSYSTHIGSAKWEFRAITVKEYDPDFDMDLSFVPPKSITFQIEDLTVALESPYKASVWIFYNTGTVRAEVGGFSASVVLDTAMENGRPQLMLRTCSARTGTLYISFHGGLINKIMNLSHRKIASRIRDALPGYFCDFIRDKIALVVVPVSMKLYKSYHLNGSLVANPVVTTNFMESMHSGSVFVMPNLTTSAGSYRIDDKVARIKIVAPKFPSLPTIDGSRYMIHLYLSEWTLNAVFNYLNEHGAMEAQFVKESLPEGFKNILDMDCGFLCVGKYFTQLQGLFPNSSMDVQIAMEGPPKAQFSEGAMGVSTVVNVSAVANVSGFARKFGRPLNERKFVFSALVDAAITLDLKVLNQSIGGKATLHGLKLHDLRSIASNMTVKSFDGLISIAEEYIIRPRLAEFMSNGIQIPKIGPFSFADGKLSSNGDLITLSANFKYNLTDARLY